MFSDPEAASTANKALSVIFILLISPVNLYLLYLQCRKPFCYQNIKAMLIISLAAGDFVLAIYPLVILARSFFEGQSFVVTCRLFLTYVTYYDLLIHFVYGIGLILLGAEVLLRPKSQALVNKTVTAVGAGSVPWILGLVIILPLCMANVNYYYCINLQSPESILAVSVFLPASLALVLNIIYNCMTLQSDLQHNQPYFQNQQPAVTYSVQHSQSNVALQGPIGAVASYEQNQSVKIQQPMVQHAQPYHVPSTSPTAPNGSHIISPDNAEGQYSHPSHNAEYSHLYQPFPQQPHGQQGMIQYNIQYNHTNQPFAPQYNSYVQGALPTTNTGGANNTTAPPISLNRGKELKILFAITLVYFMMVVPKAAVELSVIKKNIIWPDELTSTTVTLLLEWLSIARSFVTPLIMFAYQNL